MDSHRGFGQDHQECTIGCVKVLYDQLNYISKRIGRSVKIITDSNVNITLRTHKIFLDGFAYPLTRFVDKK
jgi:hypothetical protein